MRRRVIHEACKELGKEACALSEAVDALVTVVNLRNIDRKQVDEYLETLEAEIVSLEADIHLTANRVDELLDQLRQKDEQLAVLQKDYDKDVEILRETIERQAKWLDERSGDYSESDEE
jgi:peptidoglycan hydrolase CwlO-like protein